MALDSREFAKLDEGTRELVEWQLRIAGGFVTQLFELIAKADTSNRARISAGFPLHVQAFERYAYEAGWYPALELRLGLREEE